MNLSAHAGGTYESGWAAMYYSPNAPWKLETALASGPSRLWQLKTGAGMRAVPGRFGGGYLETLVRHEYGHHLFQTVLTAEQRKGFADLLGAVGDVKADVSFYSGGFENWGKRVEESFCEMVGVVFNPKGWDASSFSNEVNALAAYVRRTLVGR